MTFGPSSSKTPPSSPKGTLLQHQDWFDLNGLQHLPAKAHKAAVYHYLGELEQQSSGADTALIRYTDKNGTKDVARFARGGLSNFDTLIEIQSTTKAIFALFLLHTINVDVLDKPVKELINRPLQEICPFKVMYPHLRSIDGEWGERTLRQFLNHTSGTPFNEAFIEQQIRNGLSALFDPNEYTSYSNSGVEFAAAIHQQWIRENRQKVAGATTARPAEGAFMQFLSKYFNMDNSHGAPFYCGVIGNFRHIVSSGKMRATARQVANIPDVVKALDDNTRELLLTPISGFANNLQNGLSRTPRFPGWEDTPPDSSWHTNQSPEVICNLFYRRPYGFATMGSHENNCDVILQGCTPNTTPKEMAGLIKEGGYFTVVRLQNQASEETQRPTYSMHLQTLLGSFF